MAERHQLLAQLGVVEDLAVEGDPDRPVLVAERLLTALHVDDGEARVGKAASSVAVDAELVGAAVTQGGCHPLQRRQLRRRSAADDELPRDAAHGLDYSRKSGIVRSPMSGRSDGGRGNSSHRAVWSEVRFPIALDRVRERAVLVIK